MKKHNDGKNKIIQFLLGLIGLCLSLLGGWLCFGDVAPLLGLWVMCLGAFLLALFAMIKRPDGTLSFYFFAILMIAGIITSVLFDSGPGYRGRGWSDLSDVEKANAKWAYDAKQYIDSID